MADDQPLTSEEMIRRAREDLAQASKIPTPDAEEGTADLDPADDPDSDDPEPFTAARAPRQRRALKRARPPLPPDPFSDSPRRQQGHPRTAAIIISLVVAVLGIAVLLATAAGNAP